MKEESLLLLSDLQKLINQVVLIDYTIIILGGKNRPCKWWLAWNNGTCISGNICASVQGLYMAWSICGIRLCRSFTACGNGNFKPCGHSDSDVFPQDKDWPGGCVRPAYHDGEWSGGSCDLLWTGISFPDWVVILVVVHKHLEYIKAWKKLGFYWLYLVTSVYYLHITAALSRYKYI